MIKPIRNIQKYLHHFTIEHKHSHIWIACLYAILVLPVAFVGIFHIQYAYERETKRTLDDYQNITLLTKTIIETKLNSLLELCRSLSSRPLVAKAITQNEWSEAINILNTDNFLAQTPYIDRVVLYNKYGTIMSDFPNATPSVIGESRSNKQWFKDFVEKDTLFVTGVQVRKANPQSNIVSVIAPIHLPKQTQLLGILMLQIKTDILSSWLVDFKRGRDQIFFDVLDQHNAFVRHHKFPENEKKIIASESQSFYRQLLKQNEEVSEAYDGDERRSIFATIRTIPGIGWKVIVSSPAEVAFHERTKEIVSLVSGYLVFLVLLSIIYFFWVSNAREHQKKVLQHFEYEKKLEDSNKELDTFFTVALDFLCIATKTGYFQRINQLWEDVFGYSKQDLLSQPLLSFVHPDDANATIDAINTLKNGKQVAQFRNRYRTVDGNYRWLEWRSTPANGFIYAAARDITEEKISQDKLIENEAFLQTVTDNVPGMIAYWDHNCTCQFANASFQKRVGKPQKQLLGSSMKDLLGETVFQQYQPYVLGALDGSMQNFEKKSAKINDETEFIWVHFIPNFQNKKVCGFFMIISDITELKITHTKLEEANRSLIQRTKEAEAATVAKSEFLSNMSHEIRTPLNAIIGFSTLLEGELTGEKEKSRLRAISSSGNFLLSLVNDILTFSKLESGKEIFEFHPCNLFHIVTSTAELFRNQIESKKMSLVVSTEGLQGQSPIISDRAIRQILFNLIGNAVKFTNQGFVSITGKLNASETTNGSDANLIFEIEDSGIGISEDFKQKLFTNFSQQNQSINRQYGGTGLGLAITKKIVTELQGTIAVKSEEGKGTKFTVTIPNVALSATPSDENSGTAALFENTIEFTNSTVLVVDDVSLNREYLCDAISKLAPLLTVIEASSGEMALDIVARNPPNLVFMDVRMPGIGGLEAAKEMRRILATHNCKIIAFTASVDESILAQEIFDSYLRKPAPIQQIHNEMIKFLPHKEKNINSDSSANSFMNKEPLEQETKLSQQSRDALNKTCENALHNTNSESVDAFCSMLKSVPEASELPTLQKFAEEIELCLKEFNITRVNNLLQSFLNKYR